MSTTTELPDNATHEQIQEFVNELVEQEGVNGEKATEPEADKTTFKQTPVGDEIPADDDTAASKDSEGQDKKVAQTRQDWVDDDVLALASTLGIEDTELSQFSNRDELDRALMLLDRAAVKAGRESLSQDAGQRVQGEQKTPVKDEDRHPRDPNRRVDGTFLPVDQRGQQDQQKAEGQAGYKVGLDPEVYDEGLVAEFGRMQEFYESRLKAMEDRFARQDQIEQERSVLAFSQQFDSIVDSLDQADLFGETGKETPEQMQNRRDLCGEYLAYSTGLQNLGRKATLGKPLVERALRLKFGDHLFKQQRKQLTRKISRQGEMRMGASPSKPTEPPETLEQYAERRYKQLEEG